ncbi:MULTISPECIES: patatin-like phospholipase family protein [Marinobacter]|uniref:Patatin-like phospholipase family protein n=1 Tax=Marinobacter xiaoshiensis TaxID=3073652 RepID=A0ABU2HDS0_9GAMM|nr:MULTISPECIES: patatin-like phospholipase family protein [unclassified Marinobacter]MBK1885108.1 patatin-like phospholipase family protein [Marinobacter sp. DY40_1A1]MDS1309216.1 patatin-like phospholipase family protein [Marinobacter sp. F60267]
MKLNPFNTRIGLALGGGAAKGIAHIGVLKAFEEEGIRIHCISGTSVGALVASYYAFGRPVESILSIGSTLNLSKILNFTFERGGLFSTQAIREMIERDLGDCLIEDANIPLAICATDIETGKQLIFRSGNLADAVCASMAVPGLFVPMEVGGRILVDGGLVENVPISPLAKMGAGITVAIDLSHVSQYQKPEDTFDVISNAINIAIDFNTREQLKKADIVVPLDLSGYSLTNNAKHVQELYMEGYHPMKKKIQRVLWYKRANVFMYLFKGIRKLLPLKVPEIIKDLKSHLLAMRNRV